MSVDAFRIQFPGSNTLPICSNVLANSITGIFKLNSNLDSLSSMTPFSSLLLNQIDSTAYPFSTVTMPPFGSNLVNTTLNSQSDLDTLMSNPITSAKNGYEQFLLYFIVFVGSSFYAGISNNINSVKSVYDLDPTKCFPPFYTDFTAAPKDLLKAVFNILLLNQSGGPMTQTTLNGISTILQSISLPALPASVTPMTLGTDTSPEVANYFKLVLLGTYYLAWCGKYVFQI
jgi:hypothetical protein